VVPRRRFAACRRLAGSKSTGDGDLEVKVSIFSVGCGQKGLSNDFRECGGQVCDQSGESDGRGLLCGEFVKECVAWMIREESTISGEGCMRDETAIES
jgi:hypothetical protein